MRLVIIPFNSHFVFNFSLPSSSSCCSLLLSLPPQKKTKNKQTNKQKKFGNVGNCNGLTPGFWKNWRNHYTASEFLTLAKQTIAGSSADPIAYIDNVYNFYSNSDPADLLHLKAFILANQLTLALTNSPSLRNPSSGSLFGACLVPGNPTNLQAALSGAINVVNTIENGGTVPDATIRDFSTLLDLFANLSLGLQAAIGGAAAAVATSSGSGIIVGAVAAAVLVAVVAAVAMVVSRRKSRQAQEGVPSRHIVAHSSEV